MILDFSKYSLNEIISQCQSADGTYADIEAFLKKWSERDTKFTIRTSGTTGPAKDLIFSKHALEASARITLNRFNLKQGDIALHCLPLSFVAGKLMLVRAIIGKLKLLVVEPSSNPMKEINLTLDFAAFTPYQMAIVLKENAEKVNLISTIILGGSKVSLSLEKELEAYNANVYETFGMSETLTHCALRKLSASQADSKFEVLKGFSWLVNEQNCLEISAEHLGDKTVKTQDVVEKVDDDRFNWLGRRDNVINSGGVKIYPEQVERKLAQFFPFPLLIAKEKDDLLGEKAVLYVEEEQRGNFNKNDFKKINFGSYEKPKEIRFVKAFPRNKNGKIQRDKLSE